MNNYSVQELPLEEVESWFKPKWKQLTMAEINKCISETGISVFEGDIYIFARSIEALVQEKNSG